MISATDSPAIETSGSSGAADDFSSIEKEIANFNREALAIKAEGERLQPISDQLQRAATELEKLMAVGFENLCLEDRLTLKRGIEEATKAQKVFGKQLDQLVARNAAHKARRKDLFRRLKERGLLLDTNHNPFSSN